MRFRLSIEWARVQPSVSTKPSEPPDFDLKAIDGYADRIAACRRYGLEPVITLQHFTHPAWLGIDAWLEDGTPELFEKFVSTAVQAHQSPHRGGVMVKRRCIGSSLSTNQICSSSILILTGSFRAEVIAG